MYDQLAKTKSPLFASCHLESIRNDQLDVDPLFKILIDKRKVLQTFQDCMCTISSAELLTIHSLLHS